ncbi:S10 family serine carboxypeptidase-like protein [Endozoicomonas arenosclerae]|uniref:S10 family serine carboxypeptidase-like protein n=1 Tax=Endozoicomonas arenosclerae TaxID=1633495 RepID=UPI0007811136|nr:hypothetical protein [Endozoicomonas arenosclerae]
MGKLWRVLVLGMVCLFSILTRAGAETSPLVTSLPGLNQLYIPRQYAGQVDVDGCNHVFYWLVESASSPADDPVIVWMNGGPGSSSEIGMFKENGPFVISQSPSGELVLSIRDASWNHNASYMVIDQPSGTGFSYASKPECIPTNEKDSTRQLFTAFQKIFQQEELKHFLDNRLYIASESFGGHYVPRIAQYIIHQPDDVLKTIPKLTGISIGDGWVDPVVQQRSMPVFAYRLGIISPKMKSRLVKMQTQCEKALKPYINTTDTRFSSAVPKNISAYCDSVVDALVNKTHINLYNFEKAGGYDFSLLELYLNQPDVRKALHIAPETPKWTTSSDRVGNNFRTGEFNSVNSLIVDIIQNSKVRILLYGGTNDLCCGPSTTEDWLQTLPKYGWTEGQAFLNSTFQSWSDSEQQMGEYRAYPLGSVPGNARLIQYTVLNAGHLVPMDQPAAALEMITSFIRYSPMP